ncbi:hypothetical protein [Clostridium brassicae]|uniref:Uncharacterized protein n=1 Tax=Clostridium brassicae TaxID=2999072 RepID=A0ABT4D4B3_9CLOT|nr:hypothetical protein [Clostridium brassicae]MCY6957133.1 hypothetical protein [Clostridium brassicae]
MLKLKKINSLVLSFLFISTLIMPTQVKAEGEIITVVGESETDLPQIIESDSQGRKLERISPIRSGKPITLPEISLSYNRDLNMKYYVKWIEDSPTEGHFIGKQTNTWDETKSPIKQPPGTPSGENWTKGYQIGYSTLYEPNSLGIRSLIYGDFSVASNPAIRDGSDFFNKTFLSDDAVGYVMKTGKSFTDSIQFIVDEEEFKKQLLAITGIEVTESSLKSLMVVRTAYPERRIGKDPGLEFGVYKDNLRGPRNVCMIPGVRYPKAWLNSDNWHPTMKDYYCSGEYGQQTFNYYSPPITRNPKLEADYKVVTGDEEDENTHPGGKVGPIVFKPNSTTWSNRGKTSEGIGAYNVKVEYKGDTKIVYKGTVKSKKKVCHTNSEGHKSCHYDYYTKHFDVVYDLDRIEVNGDASKTFTGKKSEVDITHEGENLGLSAKGFWKKAKYSVPSMPGSIYDTDIPGPPPNPVGKSGDYDIDWTMPTIEIDKIAHDRAIDSLTFGIDIDDNLEPDNCLTVTAPTEYGVDGTLDNQTKEHRNITYSGIPNEDTIYEFHYDIEDEATNKRFCKFKTSIIKEYWEQLIDTYKDDLDLEVPIKFLSNSDTQTLKGFKRSKTINFDSWRGIPTEVWYKFTDKTVNFIRVIHYDDPNIPVIDENGNKLYPKDSEFQDSPGLANKIGVDVGSNKEITNYGRLSMQKPIKTVDNNDGTYTNYYVNGDVRTFDKATGKIISDKQKGYGEILPELTEISGNKTIYHTGNRYTITIIEYDSYTDITIRDRLQKVVEQTRINKRC